MTNLLFTVLKMSLMEMFYLIGLILVVGLILGFFERLSNDFMQRALGRKGIYITAWLGTPIHEIGHAIMCVIFKHRINNMKLLRSAAEDGVLGYVEHSYNPNSLYQRIGNLFIGLGPIFSGTTSLILALYFLLPHSFDLFKRYLVQGINNDKIDGNLVNALLNAGGNLIKSIFTVSNLSKGGFWIFIIIAMCVSSHIALSKADIKGAEDGILVLFAVVFIVNLILRYLSINTAHYIIQLGRYNAHLMAFLMIALMFSAITLVISIICYGISSIRR